jgi:hypothetical protein
MKVRDFLHVIIKEYNDYFKQEEIPIYFFPDEFTTYELYMCDEDYNPDEEYPGNFIFLNHITKTFIFYLLFFSIR